MAKKSRPPISQFAGLKELRDRKPEQVIEELAQEQAFRDGVETNEDEPAEATERRRVGRPPGKRSNPNYEQTTLFLDVQTKVDARNALEYARRNPNDVDAMLLIHGDLSDLVNSLLNKWLESMRRDYQRNKYR